MVDIKVSGSVEEVMHQAKKAFDVYKKKSGKEKADFLGRIADSIESQRAGLVPVAMEESHLPEARLQGELSRTTNQLRLFAELLREGSWVEASIDRGMPERKPLPRPDIRKMLQPVGPVVVFGASNFPFAFSTAGGDSASVLASGSTLVVKGHPAHPKTSRMMYEAMHKAVVESGLPQYTIQHVSDASFLVGQQLVEHPLTAGVGFTGSYKGGRALIDYAANRKCPIPVFAEMGSVNPVVLYPEMLSLKSAEIAQQYAGSITAGMGQFCTNPGLILGIKGDGLTVFMDKLGVAIKTVQPMPMLHEGIHDSYVESLNAILEKKQVTVIARSETLPNGMEGHPTVVSVSAGSFLENEYLQHEVFGPYSIVVVCDDKEALKQVLSNLEGQLTSTIVGTENDMVAFQDVVDLQIALAGRILVNDVPTGVEVCNSMVHGGPYPATADGRFTSVGTTSIKRWVRPVCYQGFPQQFLPEELKDGNPLQIWRCVDNTWSK